MAQEEGEIIMVDAAPSPSPVPLSPLLPPPLFQPEIPPARRPWSPPSSPAPTVLVSLQAAEPSLAGSGQLSLHEYRRNQSLPQVDVPAPPSPARTLKRKPKRLNLRSSRSPRLPPSPPRTPLPLSPSPCSSSSFSLVEELLDSYQCEHALQSPTTNTADTETGVECLPSTLPLFSAPDTSTQHITTSSPARTLSLNIIPNVIKDRIRRIPAKISRHSKSTSDTALVFDPQNRSTTTLNHCGVEFEILNPPRPSASRAASPSKFRPRGLPFSASAPSLDTMLPSESDMPPLPSDFHTKIIEHRPTPPRTLFKDLPTAYSTIRSRSAAHRTASSPAIEGANDRPSGVPATVGTNETAPEAASEQDTCTPSGVDDPGITSQTPDGQPPISEHSHQGITVPDQAASVGSSSSPITQDDTQRWRRMWSQVVSKEASLPAKFMSCRSLTRARSARRRNLWNTPTKLVKRRPYSQDSPSNAENGRTLYPDRHPILARFLNRHQPNFHSARGRVDKSNTIDKLIRPRYSLGSESALSNTPRSLSRAAELMGTDQYRLATVNSILRATDPATESIAYEPVSNPAPLEIQDPDPNMTHETTNRFVTGNRLSTDFIYSSNPPSQPHSRSASTPYIPAPSMNHAPAQIPTSRTFTHSKAVPHDKIQENTYRGIQKVASPSFTSLAAVPTGAIANLPSLPSVEFFAPSTPNNPPPESGMLGPGSSQSTSTQQLSQRAWSFATLRSRLGIPSTSSSWFRSAKKADASTCRDLNTLHRSSRTSNSCAPPTVNAPETANATYDDDIDYAIYAGYLDNDKHDEEEDWETVAGSQQFAGHIPNNLPHVDTGSSLADYSTFGSLAGVEARTWTPLRSPRHSRLSGSFQHPGILHPGQADLPHFYQPHEDHGTGQQVLLSHYHHRHPSNGYRHFNSLAGSGPKLMPTAHKYLAPRIVSTGHYQHPKALENPHRNPFRVTPPNLLKRTKMSTGRDEVRNSWTGPFHANRNSKLTIFGNLFHNDNKGDGNVEQFNDSRHENIACAPATHSPPQSPTVNGLHIHRQGDSALPAQSQQATQTNHNNRQLEGPIQHSIPGPFHDGAFGTDANENHSGHSVHLGPNPASPPPAYHPASQRNSLSHTDNRRSVSVYSRSTERLVGFGRAAPHPRRSIYRSSCSSTHGLINNWDTRSWVTRWSEAAFRDAPNGLNSRRVSTSERLPPSIPRSPLMVHHPRSESKASSKRSRKSPKRDDLVRERLRQFDTTCMADFCPSTSNTVSKCSWTRWRQAQSNRSSILANIEEDAAVRDWYCSADGRYVFQGPPRLIRSPAKRSLKTPNVDLVAQKRLGRQIILLASMAVPFGWVVVALIGFRSRRADDLIRWWSGGAVEEFHYKETRLARYICLFIAAICLVTAVVTPMAVLS